MFALLASQVLSHTNTHPLSRFFIVSGPVEESSKHVSGKHGSLRSWFSLSVTISENFELLLHDRDLTFSVRFDGISRAIDNAGATTGRGLDPCVTACQQWRPLAALTC